MRDLQAIMEIVQNLLNRAEHPNTPAPEADSCRAKAQEFMQKYRLAEEDLIASDPESLAPVLEFITVCGDSKFAVYYNWLLQEIAKHSGVKTLPRWEHGRDGYTLRAGVVGYESDIRLLQMIYGAARIGFQDRVEPKVDESRSEAENIYFLRSSGLSRKQVSEALWGSDTAAQTAKVTRVYEQECRRRGEEPALGGRGIPLKTFREAYATSFVSRLARRLSQSRDAADAAAGSIQLHGRQERVLEAFYGFFPDQRPKPVVKQDAPAKTPKERPLTKEEQRRIHRRYYSAAARAGDRAGRDAADAVELERAPHAKRLNEGVPAEKGQIGQA